MSPTFWTFCLCNNLCFRCLSIMSTDQQNLINRTTITPIQITFTARCNELDFQIAQLPCFQFNHRQIRMYVLLIAAANHEAQCKCSLTCTCIFRVVKYICRQGVWVFKKNISSWKNLTQCKYLYFCPYIMSFQLHSLYDIFVQLIKPKMKIFGTTDCTGHT